MTVRPLRAIDAVFNFVFAAFKKVMWTVLITAIITAFVITAIFTILGNIVM